MVTPLSNGYSALGAYASVDAMAGGQAMAGEVVPPPPEGEVVLAAGSWVSSRSADIQVLAHDVNSQNERMTSYVIQAMLDDDAVKPALDTLKLRVLSGPLGFAPSVEADAEPATPGLDPAEARRAADFCKRAHDRLPVPIPIWGRDALNALAYGHKVAEVVREYAAEGEDAGYWTLADLKVKPRWSYHLCTDSFYNLRALYCQTADGPAYVDADHFAVFSWAVHDGDPRGSSVLRAAVDPWRRKQRAKDSRSKGDDQFGTPSLAHELPPNTPPMTTDPATGKAISTVAYSNQQLAAFANGTSFTYGNGGDVKVIESARDGVQLGNSIDAYDRAITRAIVLSDRATMNAKHYTQGGGEIGDDLITTFANFIRDWFLAIVRRQVFWRLLRDNFGRQYADAYTPTLLIQPSQDFTAVATPLSVLGQAGLLAPSQIDSTLAKHGIPRPLPGELRIGPGGPIPDELPPDPAAAPAPADPNAAPAEGVAA